MQTDLELAEVVCAECGKPISSIPLWMCGIHVKFQCEECRQRHPKVPGMADVEPRRVPAPDAPATDEAAPEDELDEDEDVAEEPEGDE